MTNSTINNYVLPLRNENPHDIVNFFALNTTGLAGQFVSIAVSNPSDLAATFSAASVGAAYNGVVSLRPENKNKVQPAPTGSTKYDVLGMTLKNTLEQDGNGIFFKYDNQRKEELQSVMSGEAVPVTTNGIYMLRSGAYVGTPVPGAVGVISTTAGVVTVTAASTIGTGGFWGEKHVVGKFLSSGVVGFGTQYALFKIEL